MRHSISQKEWSCLGPLGGLRSHLMTAPLASCYHISDSPHLCPSCLLPPSFWLKRWSVPPSQGQSFHLCLGSHPLLPFQKPSTNNLVTPRTRQKGVSLPSAGSKRCSVCRNFKSSSKNLQKVGLLFLVTKDSHSKCCKWGNLLLRRTVALPPPYTIAVSSPSPLYKSLLLSQILPPSSSSCSSQFY